MLGACVLVQSSQEEVDSADCFAGYFGNYHNSRRPCRQIQLMVLYPSVCCCSAVANVALT